MPLSGPPLTTPVNLPTILDRALESNPDGLALASAESRWTWRALDETGNRLARSLLALGLTPGDRVASLMPNRCELIVHYIACMKAGLVVTPLNYRYMAPEIDHALEVSGARILLAHAERAADLAASQRAGDLPLGIVTYGGRGTGALDFEALCQADSPGVELPLPDPAAATAIFFTSGSTGKPKGVTHTFETLGWMFATSVEALEMNSDDVMLPGASISHIGGFLFSFIALAVGAPTIIAKTFDGHELLPLFREYRPTLLWMLPAALFGLIRDHDATHDDFASIRICFAGGDKVSDALEHRFIDLAGATVEEEYGMTEIGMATFNPPPGIEKLGSIGCLMPGYEASIRDETGAEVAAGATGSLWIKARCNMIGYWDNPEATAETIQDGWLNTGDIVRIDDDGFLWFGGRKKQIIIHDGSNICPQEVEEALLAHDAVENAGVVGVHNLVHGENVWAYIAVKEGVAPPSPSEVIRFARERVGYKAPETIVVLDEMPLNATGKVDRVFLKKRAADRLAADHPE
ncbi:MAG: acyl--CoA ligase [Alphaproteobacteria bacterium]|nr:acyl--CoA ligase [Alphaproteobacteria bacterium]